MSTIKKRVKYQGRYPKDLKRKIAKSYLAGEASYAILAEENGLKNKGVVKEFVKWYRMEQQKTPKKELPHSDQAANSKAKGIQSLEQELAALRKQLQLAELKTEALETMIDLAEEKLQIDIRKKSGAK